MPIAVNIPTRLRVDPAALVERREDIAEALAAAAFRGLKNSRDSVLADRGGYIEVELKPPTFTWSGVAAATIGEKERAPIEALVRDTLVQAAEDAGVFDFMRAAADAPLPLSGGEISEALDVDRFSRLLGMYILPSYDEESDVEGVPVETGAIVVEAGGEWVHAWETIESYEDLIETLRAEIQAGNAFLPQTGLFGAIYRYRDGTYRVWILKNPEDKVIFHEALMLPKRLELVGQGKEARFELKTFNWPPNASYRIKWYASASGAEQRREIFTRFFGPDIRGFIAANAERLSKNIRASDFKARLDEKVEQTIEDMLRARKGPEGNSVFVVLHADAKNVLIEAGTELNLPSDLDLPLFAVITRTKRPKKEETGEKGEAVPGAGGEAEEEAGLGAKKAAEEAGREGVEGEREGERAEARPKAFVYAPGEGEPGAQPSFPSAPTGDVGVLECTPFQGEPLLDDIDEDTSAIRALITRIAFNLRMSPCEYAGRFCINAATVLGSRAFGVGEYAVQETGMTQTVEADTGNLGLLQFAPTASPGIQFMRHLAAVVPDITLLSHVIDRLYDRHADKISGTWQNNVNGWLLRFHYALGDAMRDAVGYIFAMTCRIFMLQLLRTSREQIIARMDNPVYADIFEQLVITQLADIEELKRLRKELKNALPSASILAEVGGAIFETWREASNALGDAFEGEVPIIDLGFGEAGEIIEREGKVFGIRDSEGTVWELHALETAIAIRQGTAEAIDPLVKQMLETKDVLFRFRYLDRGAIKRHLASVLREMLDSNTEITEKVSDSWIFAFRASRIEENLKQRTVSGTSLALQGIHLQAHEEIGEFFRGDIYYALGLNRLFHAELGRQGLLSFFEFTGLILLSILCPPAGVVVGIAVGVYHYTEALEKEAIYEALIDPELVISRADVEAELFAAQLGLVLSFVPEVGTILRLGAKPAATAGARAVTRRALRRGVRVLAHRAAARITRQVAEQLKHGLAVAIAREIIVDQVVEQLLVKLFIEPTMRQLYAEMAATGPGQGGALALPPPAAEGEEEPEELVEDEPAPPLGAEDEE